MDVGAQRLEIGLIKEQQNEEKWWALVAGEQAVVLLGAMKTTEVTPGVQPI